MKDQPPYDQIPSLPTISKDSTLAEFLDFWGSNIEKDDIGEDGVGNLVFLDGEEVIDGEDLAGDPVPI